MTLSETFRIPATIALYGKVLLQFSASVDENRSFKLALKPERSILVEFDDASIVEEFDDGKVFSDQLDVSSQLEVMLQIEDVMRRVNSEH